MSGERDSPTERELFEQWLYNEEQYKNQMTAWEGWQACAELKDAEIAKLRAELAEYREMKPVATKQSHPAFCTFSASDWSTLAMLEQGTELFARPPKEK